MKPAVYLYGVPGQYENYLAALESAGARVVRQRKTAAGKASSVAQPSRSAALLPVNSRKGADKISTSERKNHFGEIYCGLE